MKNLTNASKKYLKTQGACLLDLSVPLREHTKLLLLPADHDIDDTRALSQSIADGTNSSVVTVQSNSPRGNKPAAQPEYEMVHVAVPTVQASLTHSGYGTDGRLGDLPGTMNQLWGMLSIGVAIIYSCKQVAFINETGSIIMRNSRMVTSDDQGLHLRDNSPIARDISKCIRRKQVGGFDLGHRNQRWRVTVTPISHDYAAIFIFCCLLSEQDCIFIGERYDLTSAECKLVAQFVKTPEVADIATNLHISIPTTRTVLRNIYDKMGVNSQQRLMQLLLTESSLYLSGQAGKRRKRNRVSK